MSPSGVNAVRRVNLVVPADAGEKAIQIVSELCCDVVPQWNGLLPSDLTVSVQAGGLSNVLYKVVGPTTSTTADGKDDTCRVLVRVYGRGTESMVSRDAEVAFMSAFQPVYARFNNGHVYTYIQGEVVKAKDLREPDIMARIARHMAWHQHTCETVEALHWKSIPACDRSPNKAWANWGPEKMYELAVEAMKERKNHLSDEQWKTLTSFDMSTLEKKMNTLRQHIQQYDDLNPLTLCHNDVFPGNILNTADFAPPTDLPGETGIAFIDFEYSYTNYGLYDVANHFNEWTGLELDQRQFPSQDQAKEFLRSYLAEWRRVRGDLTSITDDDVYQAYCLTMKLTLASNCLWFFWSIAQACNSSIDFDYVDYAVKRLEAWEQHEKEFVALEPRLEPLSPTSERITECIIQ